jgi:hypothetical protein
MANNKNLVLSWGTNWNGYAMYYASGSPGATWNKLAKTVYVVGKSNMVTNIMTQIPMFYRLALP